MWKVLKEVRQRQAQWRAYERQRIQELTINPDKLSPNLVRVASGIFVGLKERKCSYGSYVFNFAFPEKPDMYPKPILIPKDFPKTLWLIATQVETEWPKGIKMIRVDAIRQPDNTIRIIELNPNWVDNIAALRAFYETYRLPCPSGTDPIETMASLLKPDSNLALIYCERTNGCKKDEIYALADYLFTTGRFKQIAVSSLRDVQQETNGAIIVRGVETQAVYLNGTFLMTDELSRQQAAIERIIDAQQKGRLVLIPSQFTEFDSKESLVFLSKQRPDIFIKTVEPEEISTLAFPIIIKPIKAESLTGVAIIRDAEELNSLACKSGYVAQPLVPSKVSGIVYFDTKTKTIFNPNNCFEKINIWIMEDKVVGALATYSTAPLISDSGYNLPLKWEER